MLSRLETASPYFLSVLRAVSGLVLFSYGTQKVLHFPVAEKVPAFGSLPYVAGCFELVLGFALLVGFGSRLSAFVLSGVMASAYFIGHFPKGFFPAQNGGTAAVILCFALLYLAVAGPGPLSLDAKIRRKG